MTQVKEPETKQEIQKRATDAPAIYGDRYELDALAQRMRVMLKAKEAPDEIMYKAAQVCMAFRFMPGEHVKVYKIGGDFVVDICVDAWKLQAKRECDKRGDTYYIPTPRPMTPEEVKAERGELYDPRDRGAVATLYLASESRLCKIMGIPYEGHTAKGFWRVKGKYSTVWENKKPTDKKEFKEDTIPELSTPQDVADRRAIKKVIKQVFALDLDMGNDDEYEVKNKQLLIERIESAEREQINEKKYTSLPAPKPTNAYIEELMDAEPLDTVGEEEGFFTEMQDAVADMTTTESPENFLKRLVDKMDDYAKGYSKELVSPLNEDGTPLVRKNEDVSGEDVFRPVLRTTVAAICGWQEAESHLGMSKADYVINALTMRSDGFLSAAAARQLYIDIAKDFSLMKKGANKDWNETRYNIVVAAGKLVDELAK